MSNHLAIATVTATLQRLLQNAIQIDHDGSRVTTVRPNEVGTATPQIGVNLFLYQVNINHIWRQTADVQARSRHGDQTKRSRTALDLHYMLSFYGNEVELEPQRLMGCVMRNLNDWKSLKKEMIQQTIVDSNFAYLVDSDLNEQLEELTLWPLDLSLEDLSKAWSVFFQTPYMLSVAYRARVVMLEGLEIGKKPLPINSRSFNGIVPFTNQPKIDRVISQAGKLEPILADSTLLIQGKHLKSDITQVWIGETEVTPTEISDTQIVLPLSSLPTNALKAGLQSLQVIHRISKVTAAHSNNGSEANRSSTNGGDTITSRVQSNRLTTVQSNAIPFVVRPTITKITVSKREVKPEDPPASDVRVRTNMPIGKKQRVLLALNELSNTDPAAYLFEAAPRRTDGIWITIPIDGVKAGRYLVRLQVDGAESQLTVDSNPDSPTFNQYNGPKVSIKS